MLLQVVDGWTEGIPACCRASLTLDEARRLIEDLTEEIAAIEANPGGLMGGKEGQEREYAARGWIEDSTPGPPEDRS